MDKYSELHDCLSNLIHSSRTIWLDNTREDMDKYSELHDCLSNLIHSSCTIWLDNTREDMDKYQMTVDVTENRRHWKIMAKTGSQRCGDGV